MVPGPVEGARASPEPTLRTKLSQSTDAQRRSDHRHVRALDEKNGEIPDAEGRERLTAGTQNRSASCSVTGRSGSAISSQRRTSSRSPSTMTATWRSRSARRDACGLRRRSELGESAQHALAERANQSLPLVDESGHQEAADPRVHYALKLVGHGGRWADRPEALREIGA
jgi:hypothetical protein